MLAPCSRRAKKSEKSGLTEPRNRSLSATPAEGAGKGDKGKGKGKGKGGKRDKSRDGSVPPPPTGTRRDHSRGRPKGKAKAGSKSRLFCKEFLQTGTCPRLEKGEKCDPHITSEMHATLKSVFGDNFQGWYNPK